MSEDEPSALSELRELEGQVERGDLFVHTALTEQIMRINDAEAFIFGLIDHLIQKGVVDPAGLKAVIDDVRIETVERREYASLGVAIRVDGAEDRMQTALVNCEERLHICRAVCCRLRFALTVEEIEAGKMKWELGEPYLNRHRRHGYCHQIDVDRKCCSIYEDRPAVCRKYSCANDSRIWKDFDNMEINQEWIDANLNRKSLGVIAVFMDH